MTLLTKLFCFFLVLGKQKCTFRIMRTVIRTIFLLLPVVVMVWYLGRKYTGCGIQAIYTVKPRYSATVCLLQFVALYRGLTYIVHILHIMYYIFIYCVIIRSVWARGIRLRFEAARLLRLWFRIPPRAWMFVCCECCVLSGTGLCEGLITLPEESYRAWCVVVCDLETSRMRRPLPALGCGAKIKKLNY
jgi:hypothetical protein